MSEDLVGRVREECASMRARLARLETFLAVAEEMEGLLGPPPLTKDHLIAIDRAVEDEMIDLPYVESERFEPPEPPMLRTRNDEIKVLAANGVSQREIGAKFGISGTRVSQIIHDKN